MAWFLGDLLTAEGYLVDFAFDGRTGLDRGLHGQFDLILLDIILPGMSGFEVCRELRREGSGVPIMILSGRAELVDRLGALKLGADDYLMKPFEPLEFAARIEALLRRSKTTEAKSNGRFFFWYH